MSSEDLVHLITEIEKRQNSDAKACLNLLKMIGESSTQSIEVLDESLAEKRLRRLLAVPIKLPYTMEKEDVKKKCRELISKWGMMRRSQKLRDERSMAGSGSISANSALSILMRKAEAQILKSKSMM